MPKISIIIPAYNADRHINEALNSALNQSLQDFEIIIVDDGSTDNTKAVVTEYTKTYPGKVRYFYQTNQGPGAARNKGMREASGEYIAFLDADDHMHESSLKMKVDFLDKFPNVSLVFSDYYINSCGDSGNLKPRLKNANFLTFFNTTLKLVQGKEVIFNEKFCHQYLQFSPYPIWTGTVMMRKSIVGDVKIDQFPTDIKVSEDRMYWIKIMKRHTIGFIDKPLAVYNAYRSSLTKDQESYSLDRLKTLKILLQDKAIPFSAIKKTKKRIADEHFSLFRYYYKNRFFLKTLRSLLSYLRHAVSQKLPNDRLAYSSQMKKKALFISYHFPPAGNTGAIRPTKFTKYLRNFGWKPVVLTCKNSFNWGIPDDSALLNELRPGIAIYRTLTFEPWNWMLSKRTKDNTQSTMSDLGGITDGNVCEKTKNIACIRKFFSDILNVPDKFQGWIPFALFRGLRIMAKEKIDVIFATSTPPSAIVVGYLLSKITKKPLVVDYRDLWTQAVWSHKHFGFFERLNRRIEHAILTHASYVISTTKARKNELHSSYPEIEQDKFDVITNGFDSSAFTRDGLNRNFTVIHAGTLYGNDGVDDFLAAVSDLANCNNEFRNNTKVIFMGSRPRTGVFDGLKDLGIASHQPHVPRNNCLEAIARSHLSLIFLKNDSLAKGCIASKIFDSMMLKKPVLAIVPEGETKRLIQEVNLGVAIDYGQSERIKETLMDFFNNRGNGNTVTLNEKEINKYHRKELTRKLAEIFDKTIQKI